MGSCYRYKRRVHAKKGKGIPIVEGRKKRGAQVYIRTVEEGVYLTFEVTTNDTSVLCREEGWEEENGVRL